MKRIKIYDADGDVLTSLAQWDQGVTVYLIDDEITGDLEVHLSNAKLYESFVISGTYDTDNERLEVEIPDKLLQYPLLITGFVMEDDKAILTFTLKMIERPQPADYVYNTTVDYESLAEEIIAEFNSEFADSLTTSLDESLTESLTTSLADSLAETLSTSLSTSLGESLDSSLSESLATSLASSLATALDSSLSESLSTSLSTSLSEALTTSLATSLEESLTTSLDSSLSESLSTSLATSLATSLDESLSSSLSTSLATALEESLSSSLATSLSSSLSTALDSSLSESLSSSLESSLSTSLSTSLATSLSASLEESLASSLAESLTESLETSLATSLASSLSTSLSSSLSTSLSSELSESLGESLTEALSDLLFELLNIKSTSGLSGVDFIDWDGNVTDSYTWDAFSALEELPDLPTFPDDYGTGATTAGWIYTAEQINTFEGDYIQVAPTLNIGSSTYLVMNVAGGIEYSLSLTFADSGSVDWGDGETSTDDLTHTYDADGTYLVTITGDFTCSANSTSAGGFFGTGKNCTAYEYTAIQEIYAGTNYTPQRYDSYYCNFLKKYYYDVDLDVSLASATTVITNSDDLAEVWFGAGSYSLGKLRFSESKIKKFILPFGATGMYSSAFSDCSNLNYICMADNADNVIVSNCSQLEYFTSQNTEIDIEQCGKLQGFTNIGAELTSIVLTGCSSITEVDISETSITSFASGAFMDCTSLVNIELPTTLTQLSYQTFRNCTSLQSIDLSGCTSLQYLGGSGTVGYSGYTFYGCTSLQSIDLSGCTSLQYLGGSGNDSGYTFYGCWNLVNITLPDSCKYYNEYSLYTDGTGLYTITFPTANTNYVGDLCCADNECLTTVNNLSVNSTSAQTAFQGCTNLTNVTAVDIQASLNLYDCPLSEDSITNIFNALSSESVGTIYLSEDWADVDTTTATDKGWTVSFTDPNA